MSGPGRKRPMAQGQGAKDFKKAWRDLFAYMDRFKKWFLLALVFAFVGTALSLIGPDLISDITDLIEAGLTPGASMDMDAILDIAMALMVIYVVSAVLTFLQNYIMATISQRTASDFRTDIARKINRIPLKYFDGNTTGDVMSRVTNDVDTVGGSLNQSISMLVTSVTMLIGSLFMMLVTNVTMAVAAVLSSLIGFVLMGLIMGRSQKHFNRQQEDLGNMNGHVEEIYAGHQVMKAYNGEADALREFDEINESLFRSGFMSQFLGGLMMPLMGFVGNFGYIVVCIVGTVLYLDGAVGFGTIVAFMMYVRLFTQPLSQISQAAIQMQAVAAASERVFEFLNEKEMEPDSPVPVKPGRIAGHVEFRDVRFGYVDGEEIIHGFSAEVQPGQKVAIVGPTGAGKTTMVNLLMRFYDVWEGDILVDGCSINDMTRADVRDMFCMVLQDTWLFEGTLRENLVYNGEDVSDERLDEVCRAVGLNHFVETLPERYDTVIGEGTTLSIGQRQQVTIARAMIEDSPLLILDEATSSVDTRTEKAIQDAMDALTEDRTSFVIAHRLSTIRNSDLILVMRDGNIIEQGDHDSLMARNGFYAELYNSQFEDAE